MLLHEAAPEEAATPTFEQDDQELLRVARMGDTAAFDALFVRHHAKAKQIARRNGVRADDVDDVVSDAFARVLRALGGGKGPTENFVGYLATAVQRVSWSTQAQRAMQQPTDDQAVFDKVVLLDIEESLADTPVGQAMVRLPKSARELLWRLEVEGEKVTDIAAITGKSPNAVSAAASRARKRLRRELTCPK